MAFNPPLKLDELWTLVSVGNAAVQDEPSERQNWFRVLVKIAKRHCLLWSPCIACIHFVNHVANTKDD